MSKKLLLVFGTRPEAIKLAPLILELRKRSGLSCRICVSAQHRDMLDGALRTFGISPDIDLNIMKENQTLFDITQTVIEKLGTVLRSEAPDMLLVHGDTTTAYASSLAAFYLSVPVAHIEAGLRSRSILSPFPEEFNRRSISLVSSLHFAPTEQARDNLLSEDVKKETVFVTGNTAIDALRYTVREDYTHPVLQRSEGKRLIMLTCHRRESIGSPMRAVFRAIRRACREREDVTVLYPMHPNPAVRAIASQILSDTENIILTEPLDTEDFHNLLARSYIAASDSGGIQEEACALHIPTVVLRERTERGEGVRAGALMMGGVSEESVYGAFSSLLDDRTLHQKMSCAPCPFGDGYASERIADALERNL